MADTLIIPKLRERIVHWELPETGAENSYPISGSFNGILILSPNDDMTLMEDRGLTSYDEDVKDFLNDSIIDVIEKQFIRVSTPDGYFVGLRYTQDEFETQSLYIIGPAHHNVLRLFAKKEDAMTLKDKMIFPLRVNTSPTALATSTIETDIPKVASATNNHPYILLSRNSVKREFHYEEFAPVFYEIILKSILDMATIPAGSIHYVPISIHEYEKMLIQGKPNTYFKTDNETPNDAIIRDYLICDGSLYKNEDYPELAKILEGERIDYWRFDSKKNRMVQTTYYNDYSKNKWFRVPDLRVRFIKSIKLDRLLWDAKWNETGMTSCDSRPWDYNGNLNKHVHFITSAIYQNAPEMVNYTRAGTLGADGKWTLGEIPSVLAPDNKMQTRAWGCFGVDYDHLGGTSCRVTKVDSNTSGCFLSIPQNFDFQNPNCEPNVGITSGDIPSVTVDPKTDADISYNTKTDFVPWIGTAAGTSYGKENTPEFFCALPIIKI